MWILLISTCAFTSTHKYLYIYTHTHAYTHASANAFMYVCVCVFLQTEYIYISYFRLHIRRKRKKKKTSEMDCWTRSRSLASILSSRVSCSFLIALSLEILSSPFASPFFHMFDGNNKEEWLSIFLSRVFLDFARKKGFRSAPRCSFVSVYLHCLLNRVEEYERIRSLLFMLLA